MTDAEEQLAIIGFGKGRSEAVCWRTVRLDAPPPRPQYRPQNGPEPGRSLALRRWRNLLARDVRPSPYRISRIDKPPQAKRA